ncbi:BTAD domain-containing putative transcriptional regulator [Aquihabitans daechungensis]|uniref:BTAD domain-containing putative transcriptional regulator n=1 Tax=Aquihabitans daechungensis TaxID=1052257 RepID=UPI003BA1688C
MSTTPSDLQLSVLGPVRARRAGTDVALGGRRQKAVLVRLAIVAGDVVPVDRLIDDLWGGEPPASAANTVQSYVSNLRRELATGAGPVIERVGDGYRLAPESVDLVATRFEQLVARASSGGDPLDADGRIALLDEALGLWHGQAIADFAEEPWSQGAAVRLDELRLAAEEARFDLLLAAGRHAVAVGELRAAVDAHPLRERFAAQLVLALYRCGRQSEALRAFDRTRAHLGDELGLDPGPDLSALADQVLRHDPALDLVVEPSAAAAPGAASTGPVAEPGGRLPLPPAVSERRTRSAFVGRTEELAALDGARDRTVAGDRRLALITGEPGMGKTRLAQVFARAVHEEGGQVLWGRSTAEDLIAYQPLVEALRTGFRMLGPGQAEHLLAAHPSLRVLLPASDGPVGVAPERYELFEAVAGVLGELGRTAPVVLVLDDAQWADRSTLSLVAHLLRDDHADGLLVVLTVRRPAGRATDDLDQVLADLRRAGRLDTVALAGMGDEDVAALLDDKGVTVSASLAAVLQSRTGGNPFFVESLADRGGDLTLEEARDLPESVRDLIDAQVAGLPVDTARVLVAAAVGGLRCDLGLLAAVAGIDEMELLDQVDTAVEAGLLAEDEEVGSVTFPHALVRQTLIARTTRNREAQLHLRFADALGSRPDARLSTATIADHLLRAGRLCPAERAATAATAAGRQALDRAADDEAHTWASRALDVLAARTDPAVTWAERADALLVQAEVARRRGQGDDARTVILEAVELARRHGDEVLLARAVQERALVNAGLGFHFGVVDDELLGLLDEALGRLGDEHRAERAALLAWSSIARNALPEREQQRALADEAETLAAQLPERPDVLALALLAARFARSDPGGVEARLERGPRMHAAAKTAGWTDLLILGLVLDANDLMEAGRIEDARRATDRLGEAIVPLHRPAFEAFHQFQLGAYAQADGDHEQAEIRSARGLELGLAAHGANALHARGGMQTMLARDLGGSADLLPLTEAMAAQYPEMPVWAATHAVTCLAAGDAEAARAACDHVFGLGLLTARDTLWATMITQLAEAVWLVGDPDQCAAVAEAIAPTADRVAVTGMGVIVLGPLARPLGLARLGAGDLDGAIDAFTAAIDLADASGLGLAAARSRMERALAAERRAAPGDAERAVTDRERADAWRRSHGVRLAVTPEDYPGPT